MRSPRRGSCALEEVEEALQELEKLRRQQLMKERNKRQYREETSAALTKQRWTKGGSFFFQNRLQTSFLNLLNLNLIWTVITDCFGTKHNSFGAKSIGIC